ncbi:MAG TPA: response regulator transcription factor [Bryobacteraceae bacterium]|jgi:two-component system KDP operon response regulator KdpE|nr:response regulator transcription factor [Bryobacteraceae bacterium]
MAAAGARILIADDEPQIRRVLKTALASHKYDVQEAGSGEEALELLKTLDPDLVILDINMPGMGGMAACREIRAQSDVPIIMLSVRNSESDKIIGLDAGADDYVTKPFSVNELLARIRANLRRIPDEDQTPEPIIVSDQLSIDFATRQVIVAGKPVRLTPKEFDLLQYLVTNANRPVAHRKLLQTLWGPEYGNEVEYLRVFVSQLRKKIEVDPAHPRYILTEPWVGYRFALSATQ